MYDLKGIDARNTQQNDTTPHKYLIICRNYNKSSENLVPYNAIRRERCAEFSLFLGWGGKVRKIFLYQKNILFASKKT
ncbi:hypothetical protein, partial [Leptospira interrogans]|uniref:hypothetical protein n=1 Tax=Leptospira interrogans TaxID=173 RepID=UPI001B8D5F27